MKFYLSTATTTVTTDWHLKSTNTNSKLTSLSWYRDQTKFVAFGYIYHSSNYYFTITLFTKSTGVLIGYNFGYNYGSSGTFSYPKEGIYVYDNTYDYFFAVVQDYPLSS